MAAFAAATTLVGHRGEVNCLHAPGDDARLASGGEDGTVRLWDLTAGRATRALMPPEGGGGIGAVCMGTGENHSHWVYAAAGPLVFGFDLRAPGVLLREPARRFAANREEVGSLALHESGAALAAADDAGEVQLLAADGGAVLGSLVGGHTSLCSAAAFRPGSAWELASAGLDSLCVKWDWRRCASVASWPLGMRPLDAPGSAQVLNPRHCHWLSYSADGLALALALGDGSVEVRTAGSGEALAAVDAHAAATSLALFAPCLGASLAASASPPPAGAYPLLSAGDDRSVRLWTVENVRRQLRAAAAGEGSSKRARAPGTAAAAEDDDDDDEEEAGGEPGFRAVAAVALPEKPNMVAASSAGGGGRGVVCVATTGDAIHVLSV